MSEKKNKLTSDGIKKLEKELIELKTIKRKEIAEKLKEARGQGDLSENAEYDAAKEEQAKVEARIAALDKMLKNAEAINEDDIDTSTIDIGSTVSLHDEIYDEDLEYTIVGSAETDPGNNRISNESPLGSVLIGKKQGDVIDIITPGGPAKYTILKISKMIYQ